MGSYTQAYTGWQDFPTLTTPATAAKLQHMDDGILAASIVFNVTSYGAVADGVTDDTAAIQAAIDAANGTNGATVFFPTGTYVVNGTIDLTDYTNIRLVGDTAERSIYWTPAYGVILKRVSGVGTMLKWEASVATEALRGCEIHNICFNGNSLAATVVSLKSLYGGVFRNLHIANGTSVGLALSTVNLSGVEDLQGCLFDGISVNCSATAAAKGITLSSWAAGGGNVSLNTFRQIMTYTQNGTGIEVGDSDTNLFQLVLCNRSGTAIGVDLLGSTSVGGGHARHNALLLVDAVGGVTTRNNTTPAGPNYLLTSRGNSTPWPTIETGSSLYVLDTNGRFAPSYVDLVNGASATSGQMRLQSNKSVLALTNSASGSYQLFVPNTLDEMQILAPMRTAGVTVGDGSNISVGSTSGMKLGTATTQKIGFWNHAPAAQPSAYTPTNVTTDRAYDANSTSIDELADVLGTLIADLQSVGLVG